MTEAEHIQNQLQRLADGEPWYGPSLHDILADVTAEQAASHPIPGAHSIWEITLHVSLWMDGIRRRIGGDPVRLTEEENWPPVTDADETAWNATRDALEVRIMRLRDAIAGCDAERMDLPPIEGGSPLYNQLNGVIQHGAYHGGQIVMLKKVLG